MILQQRKYIQNIYSTHCIKCIINRTPCPLHTYPNPHYFLTQVPRRLYQQYFISQTCYVINTTLITDKIKVEKDLNKSDINLNLIKTNLVLFPMLVQDQNIIFLATLKQSNIPIQFQSCASTSWICSICSPFQSETESTIEAAVQQISITHIRHSHNSIFKYYQWKI